MSEDKFFEELERELNNTVDSRNCGFYESLVKAHKESTSEELEDYRERLERRKMLAEERAEEAKKEIAEWFRDFNKQGDCPFGRLDGGGLFDSKGNRL